MAIFAWVNDPRHQFVFQSRVNSASVKQDDFSPQQVYFCHHLSRVTPGVSSTIETLRPTKRLKSADFPTLGFPTMATTGFGMG
jgi:hypothetical protein